MKYKIKRRHKTIKTKYIFLFLILGLILISISYAQHSSTLIVNGNATLDLIQYSVAYLGFENYTSYPSSIGYMSTYTYTFTSMPTIQSVTMEGNTLTLNTDYTYSNGTLTIPNVTGDLVIQSDSSIEEQESI